MKSKLTTYLICAIAVIMAAVAAIVVSVNRTTQARAYADGAESEAVAAEEKAKAAQAESNAENARQRAAEESARAEALKLETAKEENEKSQTELKLTEENRRIKEAEVETAKSEAITAQAKRETAKLEAEKSRNDRDAAVAIVKAEEAKRVAAEARRETERLKSEKVIADAKMLELQKINFIEIQQQLFEKQVELEERERALMPEKTIADLAWAGGSEDVVIGADGNITNKVKKVYDPVKDRSLPATSRHLARIERDAQRAQEQLEEKTRETVVGSLEKLYVAALKENRVIDASYYRQTILSLYPDWKFTGEEKND